MRENNSLNIFKHQPEYYLVRTRIEINNVIIEEYIERKIK